MSLLVTNKISPHTRHRVGVANLNGAIFFKTMAFVEGNIARRGGNKITGMLVFICVIEDGFE
ncbi:hypothetical protein WA1_05795 [Scytonema hofmannii PCC 7110]|uniref:Uncharacterized protein n=1 Tax=Scytonema hofmannii PCC 7110 TaxID=128403 RepID=A0A139WTR1_9CYAN|nr:hypothetical protein WA1_05795 [Scytonema hofmannii PCC 7110]